MSMIVEILKTDEPIGMKKGQIFEAKRYWLDPTTEVTLLRRLSKKDRTPIGKDLECNICLSNVKIIKGQIYEE